MRFVLAGLMCFALCGVGLAQTTVPYTFSAGSPALASEVNANFQALVAAINKLEGQITEDDIVGTYSVSGLQTGLHGGAPQAYQGGIETLSVSGTVTFAANGTFTSAFVDHRHNLWWTFLPDGNPLRGSTLTSDSSTEAVSGTWSLASGQVTMIFGSQSFPFYAVSGGSLLVGSAYNNTDKTNSVLLFVRSN